MITSNNAKIITKRTGTPMKEYFDIVKSRMLATLSENGYKLRSEDSDCECPYFIATSEKESVKVIYTTDSKLFELQRRLADDSDDDFARTQTYIFDEDAGDGEREANGVANEFLETLTVKTGASSAAAAAARQAKKRKKNSGDETSADFFVNRIPAIMPECREPLFKHKEHYGQLLPRKFCEEVVVVAMLDMLRAGEKKKCAEFFGLLSTTHPIGDLDTKSIIMQVLMAAVTDEKDIKYIETLVSPDFKKAWSAAKKYFGKNVKPEKESAMAKMAKYQASTLNDR